MVVNNGRFKVCCIKKHERFSGPSILVYKGGVINSTSTCSFFMHILTRCIAVLQGFLIELAGTACDTWFQAQKLTGNRSVDGALKVLHTGIVVVSGETTCLQIFDKN